MSVIAMDWAMTLRGLDMTPVQRVVLFVLCHHHNGKTGQCNPTMETVGAEAGITARAAREAIRALEHIGLVRSEKRTNERGQAANQYALFGTIQNTSGRNLRSATGRNTGSSTGRNHTTATGRNTGSSRPGGTPVPPNRNGNILTDAGCGDDVHTETQRRDFLKSGS